MLKATGNICIAVIMFFAVFDSVRNFTYMPEVFGYAKEIAIFVLLLLMFFTKISLPKIRDVSLFFYAAFLCLVFTLYHTVFSYDANIRAIIYSIKSLEFFLCLLIFWNISKISGFKVENMVNIYLKMCVILFFVNIIGFYIPNPIVHSNIGAEFGRNTYEGRFGLGQAPITLFPLLIFFIYQLAFGLQENKKYLLTLACVASIFLGVATTAIVIIVFAMFVFLFLSRFYPKYFANGFRFSVVCAVLVFFAFIYAFEKLDDMGINTKLLLVKVGSVVDNDLESDPSMKSRLNYKDQIVTTKLPFTEILFGRSYNYYHRLHGGIPIENTYANIYATSGLIGFFFFAGFILYNSLRQLKLFMENRNQRKAMFLVLLLIVFALYSYTLPITDCYTMASGFALFFAWALKKQIEAKQLREGSIK